MDRCLRHINRGKTQTMVQRRGSKHQHVVAYLVNKNIKTSTLYKYIIMHVKLVLPVSQHASARNVGLLRLSRDYLI